MKYCPHRKRTYSTKKNALTAKAKTKKISGIKLYEYKCPDCHNWHLTSSPINKE